MNVSETIQKLSLDSRIKLSSFIDSRSHWSSTIDTEDNNRLLIAISVADEWSDAGILDLHKDDLRSHIMSHNELLEINLALIRFDMRSFSKLEKERNAIKAYLINIVES